MNTKEKKIGLWKSIAVIGLSLALLAVAAGTVSAHCNQTADPTNCHGCCYLNSTDNCVWCYECGDLVNNSCTFDTDLSCPSTHGLIVNADNIIIDGNWHSISGVNNGNCSNVPQGERPRAGIYNNEHDNVTIMNLEVKHFCTGIKIYRLPGHEPPEPVEDNRVINCMVHDNGNTADYCEGIDLTCANNSLVFNCTVYNNVGAAAGSCDDSGHGIYLYGCGCTIPGDPRNSTLGHHNVTKNTIYNNSRAGIYSKRGCWFCNVSYNYVYENGRFIGGYTNYFGGGIRLECLNTNNWTVFNNTVTTNYGPGIYVRGDNNTIVNNTVCTNCNASTNSAGSAVGAGYGIYLSPDADNNGVYANEFCHNEHRDVCDDRGTGNSGNCNRYNTTCTGDSGNIARCSWCLARADLVVSDIWVNWTQGVGSNCKIHYNVTNIGAVNAPSGHNVTLYVDGVKKDDDTVPVQLTPGDSYEGYFDGYTWDCSNDGYNVTVYVDTNRVVNESDECHNSLADKFLCGDTSDNDRVTNYDGYLIYRYKLSGDPFPSCLWAADTSGNGRITNYDGYLIYRYKLSGDPLSCYCR